jgi:predicted dehydrogenase
MKTGLRFGLIGCGAFGKDLGRYIEEVGQVAALCDPSEQGMADTAAALEIDVPQYTDFRALIAGESLDAVAIAAANFVHAQICVAAAEAGLHVYCEKAMARTVVECWEMVRSCRDNGRKLMVGHKRRLRPSWSRMIELTRTDGALGEPVAITVTQYADMRPYSYPGTWWADPALGGGLFALLGVHVIDWFRAMCGEASRVSALHGRKMDEGYGFPDVTHATFEFQSGALASINSTLHYPIHIFREAQGPMIQARGGGLKLVPQATHLDLHWQTLDEEEAHHERFPIEDDFYPAYRREIGDFVNWITEDRPPCLTGMDGLRCVELMEAAYRSAENKGAWIELPLDPELES